MLDKHILGVFRSGLESLVKAHGKNIISLTGGGLSPQVMLRSGLRVNLHQYMNRHMLGSTSTMDWISARMEQLSGAYKAEWVASGSADISGHATMTVRVRGIEQNPLRSVTREHTVPVWNAYVFAQLDLNPDYTADDHEMWTNEQMEAIEEAEKQLAEIIVDVLPEPDYVRRVLSQLPDHVPSHENNDKVDEAVMQAAPADIHVACIEYVEQSLGAGYRCSFDTFGCVVDTDRIVVQQIKGNAVLFGILFVAQLVPIIMLRKHNNFKITTCENNVGTSLDVSIVKSLEAKHRDGNTLPTFLFHSGENADPLSTIKALYHGLDE